MKADRPKAVDSLRSGTGKNAIDIIHVFDRHSHNLLTVHY